MEWCNRLRRLALGLVQQELSGKRTDTSTATLEINTKEISSFNKNKALKLKFPFKDK